MVEKGGIFLVYIYGSERGVHPQGQWSRNFSPSGYTRRYVAGIAQFDTRSAGGWGPNGGL